MAGKQYPHLATMASETQQILKVGSYPNGSTGGRVELHRPYAASLIRPEDWVRRVQLEANMSRRHEDPWDLVVTNTTTLAATEQMNREYPTENESACTLMVLNFASARNPGGGWLRGTATQEESSARSSTLVGSLEQCPEYYRANRECGSARYTDHAIWSDGVTFFRDDYGNFVAPYRANVLTIPAPNLSGDVPLDPEAVHATLKHRIGCVLLEAAYMRQKYLVLGAWGCGVFRNDPQQVAELWYQFLRQRWHGYFKRVVFAIHDTSPEKKIYTAFKNVLEP